MKLNCILFSLLAICARGQNSFAVRNLVSDLPGMAEQTDPSLRNPWGLAASATSPFWISNNHTGNTTVYNSDGKAFPDGNPIIVTIPAPSSGEESSAPTGQVFNDTDGFAVSGKNALFLFATENGTISAWNSATGQTAQTVVDNSGSGAIYKGLAVAQTADGARLYAADFHNGRIDAFDSTFNQVAMPDEFNALPTAGYAPFNVQRVGQRLYVTYAKQDDDAEDDVAGTGNGYVYAFTLDGHLVAKLIEGGALNSPWGLAIAPEYFGPFSGALLVGNFGDGLINAYEPCSGQWLGSLTDTTGTTISILGLWALRNGNGHNGGEAGVLYFTAGIPGNDEIEDHGLFGSLRPAAPTAPQPPANTAIKTQLRACLR